MILVVTEKLDLRFLLQHQGRFIQSARTATEALRYLRTNPPNLQGVVLDERVLNSKLVAGYCKANAPHITLVSWQLAQRNSPFRSVKEEAPAVAAAGSGSRRWQQPDRTRYIWDRQQAATT